MSYTMITAQPYPVYEIDLSKLSEPAEISTIMKNLNVVDYVYTFEYQGKIIKHGISVDKKSVRGDRIYRQAGHLDGWPSRLLGSSGDDMRAINTQYYLQTGEHLNRLGMKIIVRDLTNCSSPSVSDQHFHVKQLERKLIKEYQDQHNSLPIGNIKDEAYVDNQTFVTEQTWNKLFDFS